MNIVRGVADLIRRSSVGSSEEVVSAAPSTKNSSLPSPAIRFGDVGDEAILNTLWERYENSFLEEAERKKLLNVFIKQFTVVYQNWEPINLGYSHDGAGTAFSLESSESLEDVVVGCSFGHPAKVIHVMIKEVERIRDIVKECKADNHTSGITYEGLPVLDSLAVIVRSVHNCKVFVYYGGIQKLVALLKEAVMQLRPISNALSADESLAPSLLEKSAILQKILVHVVLVLCNFVDLRSGPYEKKQFSDSIQEFYQARVGIASAEPPTSLKYIVYETMLQWHHKSIASLTEAGGLLWLVELLRVLGRVIMKEQWMDLSLQHLTLRTLRLLLADNSRGQNHFRSVGGLEVLLDGLGVPSNKSILPDNSLLRGISRNENPLLPIFRLHVLSLEVLREVVFGNLSNLQFISENGRVHKFANSFCSLAFMLQEYQHQNMKVMLPSDNIDTDVKAREAGSFVIEVGASHSQNWNEYVNNLSAALCSFLFDLGDTEQKTTRTTFPVSLAYLQLSVKWFLRVLLTVFPCIKACSNESNLSEMPCHLRVFAFALQHYVLLTFRTILTTLPSALGVIRAEGVWDFIFSENLFYFGPFPVELGEKNSESQSSSLGCEQFSVLISSEGSSNEVETVQVEAISLMELAATLCESSDNLAECLVLLDALEQSVAHPEIADVLAKTLLHVMQLSPEKTLSSFKTLDVIPRVLKVASVLAQESRYSGSASPTQETSSAEMVPSLSQETFNSTNSAHKCHKSVETSMELFAEYFITDDAKHFILRSSACIDCLFDLFWEEDLRIRILQHVLELMKIVPSTEEDRKAKLYLCSKYLETFTHVKEREKNFAELSVDLLVGMRNILLMDQKQYRALFRDGECFLHIVSLLNANLDVTTGENLVVNVLQTLTCLLSGDDTSKAAFRALVGKGYETLQSLLLDFCQQQPSESLLNALLDMLVDGKFDLKASPVIKNEDVILLYLNVLKKSSDSVRQNGLDLCLQMLRDSISNRDSCVRAGILNFLLDWFSQEDNVNVVMKIAQMIQVSGGHSISGKDIRKIFALLRSERVGSQHHFSSLLLTSMLSMLNEKGPTSFFDLNGVESGIMIKMPVHWPLNKGFSFTCWLRVENFPRSGTMGLFSFLAESGRGCFAVLAKDRLIYESNNQKHQSVSFPVNIVRKKWQFLCLTHTIGRAFSGGSQLRCYVDGALLFSEKCRYAKVNEVLTSCSVGAKIKVSSCNVAASNFSVKDSSSFFGQIGPVYLLNDAITSEQVKGIYCLGPSYMYSFLDNDAAVLDSPLPGSILDSKDGLASKIIFGLNAQASNGRKLFNVLPSSELGSHESSIEATVLVGTQLCSRRLLQQIIYCVGGVSVFFPLFTRSVLYDYTSRAKFGEISLTTIIEERLTAEVIQLIASVLDENLANQQQMVLLSGFSILGFLLQSVPPHQLNLETLSALKHLFNVVANSGISGLSDVLIEDAISSIFLNPCVWVYTVYKVQREMYMFLIQQFDNDPRLLKSLCRLPRVLDIIRKFYWDNEKCCSDIGGKPILHPTTKEVIGERPNKEEVHKIRLLLLSLGEMSLRQYISAQDIKALVTFFESSQDMACIEDALHMVIRAVSQKPLLASFLEQLNLLGGCHIFVNLFQRNSEPIRLLSLQFLGRLLVGLPPERKGSKFFNIAVGRPKFLQEGPKKVSSKMQPIFSMISDRLFKFPQTELLCATLFDVLLGGASPKQALQNYNQPEKQGSNPSTSQFILPQILPLIFRCLSGCEDAIARTKIIGDLLDLVDSNPSNTEAMMEYGWNSWLLTSIKLDALRSYKLESQTPNDTEINEQTFVRSLYCCVLCYYIISIKGGWQQLEETLSFLLLQCEKGGISYQNFLRDVYSDLLQRLLSGEENIFISQPCRDNALYLLKLVDDMLIFDVDHKIPFPSSTAGYSPELLEMENHKDVDSVLSEALLGELSGDSSRTSVRHPSPHQLDDEGDIKINDEWWIVYDYVWNVISLMNGKGANKTLPSSSVTPSPSFGQRALGLVESLNIPAAEMAAVVVSGGISNVLVGKPNKPVDKAMLLRGEKCPRIVFRLMILYLCKASLERASRCVQQFIHLLPSLLIADDEQSKNRVQLFIWSLLLVRTKYGKSDDGARIHVISHLIRETVNCSKLVLVSSMSRDDSLDLGGYPKEPSAIHNLIQKDRVNAAVADEIKHIEGSISDQTRRLEDLRFRMDELLASDSNLKRSVENEILSNINTMLASDERRRASFQLAYEEEQQSIAEKWVHIFRSLIDERGPWSATPFPNITMTHWKLDKTEDAWRRRQKLRRNYHFDESLCQPLNTLPNSEGLSTISSGKTGLGAHIPEQMKHFLLKGIQRITDEGNKEIAETDAESSKQNLISEDSLDRQYSEAVKEIRNQDIGQDRDSYCSLAVESESSEVLMSAPCVLVTPKRKLAGRFAVMKNFLHFFGEVLVEGTGGSSVFKILDSHGNLDLRKFNQLGEGEKQKLNRFPLCSDLTSGRGNILDFVPGNAIQKQQNSIKRHRRWNISKVKAVHWTRYLLRYTAIEIFFNDSIGPAFFNFSSQKDAKDVGNLIVATRNETIIPKGFKDKTVAISFVDRRVALEMAETARESWRRRDMTNFEYLMILNTLAGRSYNDLTQYPVFPWVIADYSSEDLDFNKSTTFRDLSKPIGALDPKRFEVFEDRYRSFCDPDIPSFHYGSHYSSMGIVLFYLLRLEPFTALHRHLQGGKFDHADRLFQSIEGTYKNCLSNTSDVKELIPEFFYMPEFLVNSNFYHFGMRQDGEPLADVILPPWAKGSSEEFINKNREALESEYVSSNLHHWIDLVFGYKQRGKPAVEAANVFYYLTYEGAVDLEDTMEDELQRAAIEDQIANFGQTPIQIFRKKHARRGPPIPIAHPLQFAPGSINLTSVVSSTSNLAAAVLYIQVLDSSIVLVNQGLTMSVKIWLTTQMQSGGNFTFSGTQDPSFGIGADILSPRKIGSPLAENIELGVQCFSTLQVLPDNFLISCGTWENSFQIVSLSDGRIVQNVRQHKDIVSCVAVTSDGSFLVTGSFDTTVMVWEVIRVRYPEKRIRSSQGETSGRENVILETPCHILCGHDDIITCLYASVELDIVISGSKDGTCVFHTLREGQYVRSLQHPSGCALAKLVVSRHGRIVLYADDDLSLHMYSINGKHIASSESNGRLNSMELSSCGQFLVCAGDQGQIVVRCMFTLHVVRRYSSVGRIITSLTVTPEECFIAGAKDGTLLVYSIDSPQMRRSGLSRNSRSHS